MMYRGQKVITGKELSELLGATEKAIENCFYRHPGRFVAGVDYLIIAHEEYAAMRIAYPSLKGSRQKFWTQTGSDKLREANFQQNVKEFEYIVFWQTIESDPEIPDISRPAPDEVAALKRRVEDLEQEGRNKDDTIRILTQTLTQSNATMGTLTKHIDLLDKVVGQFLDK